MMIELAWLPMAHAQSKPSRPVMPLRNRLILLERRMWSGIYKITWQNLASLKSWVEMCNETVMQQLKGVEEYKSVNKAINAILAEVR